MTNSLNVLPEVDRIIMLENGTFVEIGTYDELKKRFLDLFLKTLSKYIDHNQEEILLYYNKSIFK